MQMNTNQLTSVHADLCQVSTGGHPGQGWTWLGWCHVLSALLLEGNVGAADHQPWAATQPVGCESRLGWGVVLVTLTDRNLAERAHRAHLDPRITLYCIINSFKRWLWRPCQIV